MASPQLENGFIQIANELYQALYKIDLNGSEFRVVHFILYQTYGYNHTSRKLSYSYIQNGKGLSFDTVRRAIKALKNRRIIFEKCSGNNSGKEYSINKDHSDWVCNSAQARVCNTAQRECATLHTKTIQIKTIQIYNTE